jgi:hypothetical protein
MDISNGEPVIKPNCKTPGSGAFSMMSDNMSQSQRAAGGITRNCGLLLAAVSRSLHAHRRPITCLLYWVAIAGREGLSSLRQSPPTAWAGRSRGGADLSHDGAEHLDRVARVALQAGHGAATFYSSKVTVAREMTMKLANEDRDEDRDGVSGFDSKAARAREFAAQAGLTAFALHASATGAVHAFHELTGEEWKPYEAPIAPSRTVSAQAAAAQIDALG